MIYAQKVLKMRKLIGVLFGMRLATGGIQFGITGLVTRIPKFGNVNSVSVKCRKE